MKFITAITFLLLLFIHDVVHAQSYVRSKQGQFFFNGQPYYFIGTNYWYGGLLGLEKDPKRGKRRLQKELDFLKSKGVENLRVVIGAEGSGAINGVERIGPPLQT